jgi:hypothetical protein
VPALIEQGGEKIVGQIQSCLLLQQVVIDKCGQLTLSGVGMVCKAATVVSIQAEWHIDR